MSDESLRDLLDATITQLEDWAHESVNDGWSTHQVEPMRRLAEKLRRALHPRVSLLP